jgi:hypothetical protein
MARATADVRTLFHFERTGDETDWPQKEQKGQKGQEFGQVS